MSREYTEEEIRETFLEQLHIMVDYWDKIKEHDTRGKLSGLCHSILAMLDGRMLVLPGFVIAPCPHEDDKAFNIKEGRNYFPEAPEVECDIGGDLAALFYHIKKSKEVRLENETAVI